MRALHTPQQETNVAYNPGVSYRGGEFMAQGISQAGNAITAGLAQFAKNREERDYMDERMKSVAAELGKYRDFEKSASEDDTSPAGTLLKTFSNWDNKPLAAKKAALVDADHLITKSERNLDQARAEQYQMLAVQDRQAQFVAQQKQQAADNDYRFTQAANAELDRIGQRMRGHEEARRAEKRLSMDETAYADTVGRLGRQDQEAVALRGAVGNFVSDFNRFAEGPQFNGTGMQRPMGQFEAYRRALGANPRAVTPQMMDDLGRMAVSEDRLGAGRSAEPSVFTDPNGNQWVRHGNNPLQRSKTEEQIAAELAAKTAPRAMAPEGSVEATLNGVKVLVGPDGRIYKMPAVNPLAALLDQAGKGAPSSPPTVGSKVSDWWNNRGAGAPATNAPPSAPSGAPVVRWGLDATGNPVKLR
jgi:hypothetical protein